MEMWNGGSFAWRSMEDGGIFVRFGEREERKVRENEMKREKSENEKLCQNEVRERLNEVVFGLMKVIRRW